MLITQNNKEYIEQEAEQYKKCMRYARTLAASVNRFKAQIEFVGQRNIGLDDVVDFERDILTAYVSITNLMSVYSDYHYQLNLINDLCQSQKDSD